MTTTEPKPAPEAAESRRKRKKVEKVRGKKYNRREAIAGYLFISPWIVRLPGLHARRDDLQPGHLVQPLQPGHEHRSRPAGFDNYEALIDDPKVMLSLRNTLFYAVLAVPLEICFALFLALLLNRVGRGAGVFRTLYYLPKMTPAVATASIFLLLLNGNSGAINQGLAAIGIQGPQWLIDPAWVKPSIVLMTLWGVSGTMVIFLAALKNVPARPVRGGRAGRRRPDPAVLLDHPADDLQRHLLQHHRADDRGDPGVRPGVPAVLA